MNAPHIDIIDNNIAVWRNSGGVPSIRKSSKSRDSKSKNNDGCKEDDGSDESNHDKYHGHDRKILGNIFRSVSRKKMIILLVLLSGTAAFYRRVTKRRYDGSTVKSSAVSVSESKVVDAAVSTPKPVPPTGAENQPFFGCDLSVPPNNVVITKKVEPLWLPAYPTSLPVAPYTGFIAALTGVKTGAMNYYRSSKTLKKCHHLLHSSDLVDAITCELLHPIILTNPSHQAANFGNIIILALRNPLTAFPEYHQFKAEEYHGQKGQVDHNAWIEFRDTWVGAGSDSKLFIEWKQFVMEWRGMKPYSVGVYMPHEDWTDVERGPETVKRLSTALEKEGFPVLYDDESTLECMWKKHFYQPMLAEEKRRADDGWYVPDYTKEQLEMMASGLETFGKEIMQMQTDENMKRPGDVHLIIILRSYWKDRKSVV